MEEGGLSVRHRQHLRHAIRSTEKVTVKKVKFEGEKVLGDSQTGLGPAAEVRSSAALPPRTRSWAKLQREASSV